MHVHSSTLAEQRSSLSGPQLHLQLVPQANTTASAVQIDYFDFLNYLKPRGDTVREIGNTVP
jgi:hypothetical protein